MAFGFKAAGTDELVLSDGSIASGLALPVAGADQFVFLDATESANPLVIQNISENDAKGGLFDDNSSTSSGIDLFELAPTKGAFASDLTSDARDSEYQTVTNQEHGGSSPLPPAESVLNVAPNTVAMSTPSGMHDSSNPFTAYIPADGIQTVVPPESTFTVPVTKTPVDTNAVADSPFSFVTTPGDSSAAVLVNGDGEIVSALSNSKAGDHSGGGGGGGGQWRQYPRWHRLFIALRHQRDV